MPTILLCRSAYFELISHAPDRLDIVAVAGHFAAQLFNVGINGSGVAEIIIIPDAVQDLFS